MPLPPIALLVVAGLPLLLAIVIKGDGASEGLVAGVVAWAVLLGGLASARPLTDRLRWMVPPRAARDRVRRAAVDRRGGRRRRRARGLRAARARSPIHHYDERLRLRHRGVRPPAWVTAAGLGWDGRLLLGVVLLVAGALPAGFYVLAVLLAALFVTETRRRAGGASALGQAPVYDDEEDEAE